MQADLATRGNINITDLDLEHKLAGLSRAAVHPTNLFARQFMQHFQLLRPLRGLRLLAPTPPMKFAGLLRRLDKIAVKNTLVVPLLYVGSARDTTFRRNDRSDPVFTDFVRSLGLSLGQDQLRTGNFNHIRELVQTTAVVYDTNCFTELAFLVPSARFSQTSLVSSRFCYTIALRRGGRRRGDVGRLERQK